MHWFLVSYCMENKSQFEIKLRLENIDGTIYVSTSFLILFVHIYCQIILPLISVTFGDIGRVSHLRLTIM